MSHDLYSEESRKQCIERLSNIRGYKKFRRPTTAAAVLIPLCFVHNIPSILFLSRPLHLRSHPGEIAFPGGRCDPKDEGDVVRTALREAHEEVGLPPDSVDVWMTLPSLDAGPTIHPVIGFCGHLCPDDPLSGPVAHFPSTSSTPHRHLFGNPDEVSHMIFRSVNWLAHSDNLSYTEFRFHSTHFLTSDSDADSDTHPIRKTHSPHQMRYILPAFGGHSVTGSPGPRIWGLTAVMTYYLLYGIRPPSLNLSDPVHSRLLPLLGMNSVHL